LLREPTLSLHPTLLLAQLAEEEPTEQPIFVEGSGEKCLGESLVEHHVFLFYWCKIMLVGKIYVIFNNYLLVVLTIMFLFQEVN
jgi:hypothetical protein